MKNKIDNHVDTNEKLQVDRRAFMKKAVYAAPTLVALGALTRPTDAKAGFGKPPSGPNWQ